jgi:uncharacterized metal-binding protein
VSKNCLDCSSKSCKTNGSDCFGLHQSSIKTYGEGAAPAIIQSASQLVDKGRAGQLSRFQEVIEFCQSRDYKNIGLAYCFGMEPIAGEIRTIMKDKGLNILPARCTMGGVRESEIDPVKNGEAISCNPAGQAHFLNERADFVIEMGLCLGHDVLFHQELTVPFTVLIVKDRVYNHNPLEGIKALSEK